MRVRYVIEKDVEPGKLTLGLVDSNGEYVYGGPTGQYDTTDEAKADAAQFEGPDLKWKDAPKEWHPDALLVSTSWNDEGWDNRE